MPSDAPQLAVHFVLDPGTAAEGAPRHRALHTVEPVELLRLMAATNVTHLSGGFCIVVDGVIWNALRPAPFDPSEVDCIVDDVTDASVFLSCMGMQAEGRHASRIYLTEYFQVELQPGEGDSLHVGGGSNDRSFQLPRVSVAAVDFYRKLSRAAEDFVAFQKRLLEALWSATMPRVPKAWTDEVEARLHTEQWEFDAAQLVRFAGPVASSTPVPPPHYWSARNKLQSLHMTRRVEHGDVPVRVISLVGRRQKPLTPAERKALGEGVAAALAATPELEVAVLDVMEAVLPWARKDVKLLHQQLAGIAWVWAAPATARDGLEGFYTEGGGNEPDEWFFPSLALALDEVRRRRHAGRYVLHDPSGREVFEGRWSTEGYHEIMHDAAGPLELRYVARRMVAVVTHDPADGSTITTLLD